MSDGGDRPDFGAFDAQLERLKASQAGKDDGSKARERRTPSSHVGLHIGVELVAGVIGGAVIGYLLDTWLDTRPLWLVVLLVLGSAAGMLNAHRYITRLERDRATSKGPDAQG